ncbi:hypothetical protein AFK68_05110, partial [Hydrocoleum sp. CS-953]
RGDSPENRILGSMSPLKSDTLRYLSQRCFSPQAFTLFQEPVLVCPTVQFKPKKTLVLWYLLLRAFPYTTIRSAKPHNSSLGQHSLSWCAFRKRLASFRGASLTSSRGRTASELTATRGLTAVFKVNGATD